MIDGSDGFLSGSGTIAPGVNVDAVDIMTDHAYPRNIALVNSEITIAKQYNKGFLIGGKSAEKGTDEARLLTSLLHDRVGLAVDGWRRYPCCLHQEARKPLLPRRLGLVDSRFALPLLVPSSSSCS